MLIGHCFTNFHNEGARFFEGKREVIDVNSGSVASKDSVANNCSELEISGVGCESVTVPMTPLLPLKATTLLIIFFFFLGLYTESVVSGKGFLWLVLNAQSLLSSYGIILKVVAASGYVCG